MPQSEKRRTIPIIVVCLTLLVCFTVNTQIANADQITDGQDTTSDCKSLPSSISVVDASNDVSKAPVSFSSNTFNLNFPAYCNPVDIYFAILTPDNKLIFTDSNGKLTLDYLPYAAGSKSAVSTSFSVADSALATEIAGKCVLYWLVAPTNGGDILKSIELGNYELGVYPIAGVDTNAFKVVSVEAEKYEPFVPVEIKLEGVNNKNFDFNNARLYFNEIEVPVYSVSDNLHTVKAFIPYVLGDVAVSFYDGKHFTSNKITLTINKTVITDTEIEAVKSKVVNELETMIADVQANSSKQNLSAESKAAYAEIETNTKAIKELSEILLNEIFSQEEREQFAALMLNSGLMNLNSAKSKKDTNKFASFTASPQYEAILETRKAIEEAKLVGAVFQFRFPELFFLSVFPPVATLLNLIDISVALTNGAKLPEPSVLDSFSVKINEPPEGIYRDTMPHPTITFEGNFVSLSSTFAAVSSTIAKIAWTIGSFDRAKQNQLYNEIATNHQSADNMITVLIKSIIDGVVDVNATAQKMYNSIKNIGTPKRYDNVVFNINDFESTMVDVSGSGGGDAIFNEYNGEVTLLKPGVMKFKFSIIDSLKEDGKQFVESELLFTIKNYPPELKEIPTCVVDKDGICNFVLNLEDKDNEEIKIDILSAQVDEDGKPQGGVCYGNINGFEYEFNKYNSPVVENITASVNPGESVVIDLKGYPFTDLATDKVTIKYKDPYEYKTVDIPIDLSAIKTPSDETNKYKRVTYHIGEAPKKGTLQSIINVNQLRYDANDDAEGEDTFTYWVEYEGKSSNPATVSIKKQCKELESIKISNLTYALDSGPTPHICCTFVNLYFDFESIGMIPPNGIGGQIIISDIFDININNIYGTYIKKYSSWWRTDDKESCESGSIGYGLSIHNGQQAVEEYKSFRESLEAWENQNPEYPKKDPCEAYKETHHYPCTTEGASNVSIKIMMIINEVESNSLNITIPLP